MPRNPDLLRRMYGKGHTEPRPAGVTYGVLPLLWIVGLVLAFLLALGVSIGSLILAATSRPPLLEMWGVLEPEEVILAVHDHSAAQDGTAGCVITGPRLVRWDERETTASVTLRGAEVLVTDGAVEARGTRPGQHAVCPFDPEEDAEGFAALARRWTR